MKRLCILLIPVLLLSLLGGCSTETPADIAATTLPVYEFTVRLCQDTGLTVARIVTEPVSCLHDYSLQVSQMRTLSGAQVVVQSGAGLEDFLSDALSYVSGSFIDASQGIPLLEGTCHHTGETPAHTHQHDSHIWLSPANAKHMAVNIAEGLSARYPDHAALFDRNLQGLLADLDTLQAYGETSLQSLSTRQLITFHEGFAYFAQAFDLEILRAVEEESGSEASAQQLKELIGTVQAHQLPAVFTERNGSTAAAGIICRETGAKCYSLDMAMAGNSYFEAMYYNIQTIQEALS